jgi:hypothetical protein
MSAVNSVFVVISLLNQLMSAVNSVLVVISCIESLKKIPLIVFLD